MRQISSDNIVRMEKRATNKFGLFLVFLAVIAIFGGGGFLIYKYRDQIDWNIKLPWSKESKSSIEEEEEKSNNKTTKKELIIPRITEKNTISDLTSSFSVTEIKADDRGYVFTIELLTEANWANLTIEKILLDGYNTEATLEISDAKDIGEQKTTTKTIRINQTDLDKFNINGFSRLAFFYILEEPDKTLPLKMKVMTFESEYTIINGNKGLIKVDEKGSTLIEYSKTVKADNATYIYFEAQNSDLTANREIIIKRLMINNRLYEMPEFTETIYRGSRKSFYIKIPKEKIKNVNELLISFFILKKDDDGINKEIYITNEYSRTL